MKDTAASSKPKVPTSFSAKNIAGALLATAGAVTTGVVAKQQLSGQPRRKGDAVAKRNRSPQIEAAHNRKPVDPAKVRATAIGARREQGDPYKRNKTNVQNAVRAAEAADARNSRPPMAGGDRGNLRSNRDQVRDAIQATERADAREKARFQAPPEAAPKVEDTKVEPKSTPTEFAPKQSVASRIRDAFRPTDEFREIQAARKRGQAAPTTVTPPTSTEQPSVGRRIVAATSDARSEALAEEQAARQAVKAPEPVKEIETPVDEKPGKVKSTVSKVADKVVPGHKKRKEKKAAETEIKTPVDPKPKADPVEAFTEQAKDLTAEERQIEISKREAALETDRAAAAQRVANAHAKLARQKAAAAEQGLETDVVMPKPKTQAEDQAEARERARLRKLAPKPEGYTPWSPEDVKAATPAERQARQAELEKIQAEEAKAPKAPRASGDRRVAGVALPEGANATEIETGNREGERRQREQRVERRRQQSDRYTKTEAKQIALTEGWDRGVAPQRSSRRKKGSDRRSRALPATVAREQANITTPPVSENTAALKQAANAPASDNRAGPTTRRATKRVPKPTTGAAGRRAADPTTADLYKEPSPPAPKATQKDPVDAVVKQHADAAKNAEPERTAEPTQPKTRQVRGNKQFWNVKKQQWETRGEVDPTTAVTDRGAKTNVPARQVTSATGDAVQDLVLEDAAQRGRTTQEAKIEAHSLNTPVSTTASTPTAKSEADKKTAAERGGLTEKEFKAKTTVVPPKEKPKKLTPEEEEIIKNNKKRMAEIETELAEAKAQTTTIGEQIRLDNEKRMAEIQAELAKDAEREANIGEKVTEAQTKTPRSQAASVPIEGTGVGYYTVGELDAVEKRQEDRRQEKRRKDRSTKAEATTLLEGTEREGQAVPKVTTRRSPGRDPRGTGTNPLIKTPVDPVPEVDLETKSVSETAELTDAERAANEAAREVFRQEKALEGTLERRRESILDSMDAQDWKETRERAKAGDLASQELLNKGRAEWRGREKARREADRRPRQQASVEKQLQTDGKSATEGRGATRESTPLAIKAQPDTAGIKVTTPVTDATTGKRRTNVLPSISDMKAEQEQKPTPRGGAQEPLERRAPSNRVDAEGKQETETRERRRSSGRRVVNTPVGPAMTVLPEERRIVETVVASGEQRKHQLTTEERSTSVRGNPRGDIEDRREGKERRVTRGEGPTGTETGARTYNPATHEAAQTSTPGQNKATTEGWWTGAKKSIRRVYDVMGKAKQALSSPMIDTVAENARKTHARRNLIRQAGKGTVNVGIGAAVLGGLFSATEATASYFDADGAGRDQRQKLKDAGETALEVGMDTAVGVTEFTAATKAAAAAGPGGVPFTLAANVVLPIGVMAGTAAAVGGVAGKTKHQWDEQVQKEIAEKAVMDAKYGTVERATQTRRNRNRKISLDDAGTMLDRQAAEAKAKRDKRIKDAKKLGRRPRGV
jgi:hypothetical protein